MFFNNKKETLQEIVLLHKKVINLRNQITEPLKNNFEILKDSIAEDLEDFNIDTAIYLQSESKEVILANENILYDYLKTCNQLKDSIASEIGVKTKLLPDDIVIEKDKISFECEKCNYTFNISKGGIEMNKKMTAINESAEDSIQEVCEQN